MPTFEELTQQYSDHLRLGRELLALHRAFMPVGPLEDTKPERLDEKRFRLISGKLHAWDEELIRIRAAWWEARPSKRAECRRYGLVASPLAGPRPSESGPRRLLVLAPARQSRP